MDRALAALERKDQYRRIAMGACALRLQMLALPRPAIIDFAAEREREDKRRFRLRIRRRKARAAQEHAVEVVSRLKARSATASGTPSTAPAHGSPIRMSQPSASQWSAATSMRPPTAATPERPPMPRTDLALIQAHGRHVAALAAIDAAIRRADTDVALDELYDAYKVASDECAKSRRAMERA